MFLNCFDSFCIVLMNFKLAKVKGSRVLIKFSIIKHCSVTESVFTLCYIDWYFKRFGSLVEDL